MLTEIDTNVTDRHTADQQTVVLRTQDTTSFCLPVDIFHQCGAVQEFLKDSSRKGNVFNVKHITPTILARVISYLQDHKNDSIYKEEEFKANEEEKQELDSMLPEDFLQLVMAADVLQIPSLIHLCATVMADRINGKDADEIRKMFDVDALGEYEDHEMEEEVDGQMEHNQKEDDDQEVDENKPIEN